MKRKRTKKSLKYWINFAITTFWILSPFIGWAIGKYVMYEVEWLFSIRRILSSGLSLVQVKYLNQFFTDITKIVGYASAILFWSFSTCIKLLYENYWLKRAVYGKWEDTE